LLKNSKFHAVTVASEPIFHESFDSDRKKIIKPHDNRYSKYPHDIGKIGTLATVRTIAVTESPTKQQLGRGESGLFTQKASKKSNSQVSKAAKIGLAIALTFGWLPAMPPAAKADAAPIGVPGGVSKTPRLWLKADQVDVTSAITGGKNFVSEWKDSSGKDHSFINNGTIGRPQPYYVPSNPALNDQPSIQFERSGGSILTDADGVFAADEEIDQASAFVVAGGAPSIANTVLFTEVMSKGKFQANLPHTSGSIPGQGSVLWDAGYSSSDSNARASSPNAVLANKYNIWGLHLDTSATVVNSVYQSIVRDGQTLVDSKAGRTATIGGIGAMSLGSAPTGGSGYNGHMAEMILFTDPLSATEKRQVETYLAIKYGIAIKSGDYLSAGSTPQVVWDAAANTEYNNSVAGIANDTVGALDQRQSRSGEGPVGEQVIISSQGLADKQYLIWGNDNGSIAPTTVYQTDYKRLGRTWKVQNTGNVGEVQVAIPKSAIPLGGILITSGNNNFSGATNLALNEITIGGTAYFAASATLVDGMYFTFAETLPQAKLNTLEVWHGTQNVTFGFDPTKAKGYEIVLPKDAANVKLIATADVGTTITTTLSNYQSTNVVVLDMDQIAIVPGVNELRVELDDPTGGRNTYELTLIRSLEIDSSGKVIMNNGSVSASSYQGGTDNLPYKVIDGTWGDDEEGESSRWSASGSGEWIQFDLGQPTTLTYAQIAYLSARTRQSSFEIWASNDADFTERTVVVAKRNSRVLTNEDSIMQPYVFEKTVAARYLRIVGYGNSSNAWNSIMEVELYTGVPPVVNEPKDPQAPPQAGDVKEGDIPAPILTKVEVSTAAALQQALDNVTAGTEIILKSGNYEQEGPFVVLNKNGTAVKPIRIKAEELGEAVFVGESYLHIENSTYIEVEGLTFKNGIGSKNGTKTLEERGLSERILTEVHPGLQLYSSSKVSILRNTFALDETGQAYKFGDVWCKINIEGSCRKGGDSYDPNGEVYTGDTPYTNPDLQTTNGTHRHFIRVEGISSHNRIAYNDIGPKTGFGAVMIYDGAGHSGTNISQYDVIEYNYFHDIGPRVSNGLEAIRLGLSSLSLAPGYVTIQYNLFENFQGEDEIISVKSSDNIIRYNTVRNSYGGFVARHGHRNQFYGNFMFGDGKTAGSSGFRIYGNDHKIYNNYMEGLTDRIIRLDGGVQDAGPDGSNDPLVKTTANPSGSQLRSLTQEQATELLRGHWRQYNNEIYNNTIVNVGGNTTVFTLGGRNFQPVGTKIYNNIIFSNAGTIFNETSDYQKSPAGERGVYAGNLIEGTASISNNAAVTAAHTKTPLQLVRSNDGLIRLSASSPAIDAAVAPYIASDDMDGQIRYSPDVGADEYQPGVIPTRGPLTKENVGPKAKVNSPTIPTDPVVKWDKIVLDKTRYDLNLGETVTAVVYGVLGDTSVKIADATFRSQNTRVAVIDENGIIQAKDSGQTEILAVYNSLIASANVYVSNPDSGSGDGGGGGGGGGGGTPPPTNPPVIEPERPKPSSPEQPRTPSQPAEEFADVVNHWAKDVIVSAVELGIVNGYEDGSFKPDEPITRVQFAALLVRALGLQGSAAVDSFADQSAIPDWAKGELGAALRAGILQGYEDQTLRPNATISRAEMITMLLRAYPKKAEDIGGTTSFSDSGDIPAWAIASVAQAEALGLIEGQGDNTFAPQDSASRAQALAVIMRMLGTLQTK
jgi:hypothetical protein